MAGAWKETTLGEVLTLQRGFDLPESQRADGHYPVIASTGQVGTHATAMAKGPGVVIGRSGSLGGGQYIVGDFWPLNTTLWIKDFKGNDRRFCYYLLKSLDLSRFNAGSGVPTLNRNHIHPLPITITTSLAEQQAIAHILGTLDDKIELNRQMNKTLEEMARAIFKSWFVDFDPVRAKAAGLQTPGLKPEIATLFPDSFEDSELDEIPKGWSVRPIGEMVQVLGGGTPRTSNPKYWDGEIPWFSVVESLLQRRHGSVFNTITRDTLKSIKVVTPPNVFIFEYERVTGAMLKRILCALHETHALAALRDTLLPKLISGELRIKDAERFLKERGL